MKVKLVLLLAVLGLAVATPSTGADLLFSPENVTLTLPSGQSGSTQVNATVNNPPPPRTAITFQLRVVGGSLPSSWLKAQPLTITNTSTSLLLPFSVAVPANTASRTYMAYVQPVTSGGGYPIAPSAKPLSLRVVVSSGCNAAPTVAITSVEPAEFKAPNGRLEDVAVAGTVSVPAGCTLSQAWFDLVDEYGVYNRSEDFTVAADGTFSVSAQVEVSRNGDDKDGRTYRITVRARDEAGTGESAPGTVAVRHDQRGGK